MDYASNITSGVTISAYSDNGSKLLNIVASSIKNYIPYTFSLGSGKK
jgi:hypothetical protein